MNKIKVKNIIEPITLLYDPDNKFIGYIKNMLEFDDVRLQIVKSKIDGYYIKKNRTKIYLHPDGTVTPYDKCPYTRHYKIIHELVLAV